MKLRKQWISNWTIAKLLRIEFSGSEAFYILYGNGVYGLAIMVRGYYLELSLKYDNYNRKDRFNGA